jgi:hypothetical protein
MNAALAALGRDYGIDFNSPAARATLESESMAATPKFRLAPGTRVHITSVNVRRENHGDDNVPSLDIGVEFNAGNDALAMFDSRLKAALYQKGRAAGEASAGQGELDLPVSDLPSLRFPDLAPLHWNAELHSQVLTVFAASGEVVELAECKVNKFVVQCIEGGSLRVTFRVQKAGVERDEYGALAMMLDTDVDATLHAFVPDRQQQSNVVPMEASA